MYAVVFTLTKRLQVQGDNPFFGNWSITREIMTPMRDAHTGNKTYYSTMDIYLQHPREHWTGAGPDHGIQCAHVFSIRLSHVAAAGTESVRVSEIANGDILFSPFVSAGWSGKAERNMRPAQWLGLMKVGGTIVVANVTCYFTDIGGVGG